MLNKDDLSNLTPSQIKELQAFVLNSLKEKGQDLSCPFCGSLHYRRNGLEGREECFLCLNCKKNFVRKNDASDIVGVYFINGKYQAKIDHNKRRYFLGTYLTAREATQARKHAESILWEKPELSIKKDEPELAKKIESRLIKEKRETKHGKEASNERMGKTGISIDGYSMKITRYGSTSDIDVLINDKFLVRNTNYRDFSSGRIRHPDLPKYNDLSGRVFGRLKVVKLSHKRDNKGKRLWECECSCGTKPFYAITSVLNAGGITSCGCKLKERNLEGRIFGRWKVIKKSEKKRDENRTYWICECSCKKKTVREVNHSSLVLGLSQSCGCIRQEQTWIEFENFPMVYEQWKTKQISAIEAANILNTNRNTFYSHAKKYGNQIMQHTEKLGEKMNLEKDAKKTIEVTISSFHKDEGKEIAEILIESFDSFVKSFFQEVLPCTQK